MNIEDLIFKGHQPIKEKLLAYGFQQDGENFVFESHLAEDAFKVVITVSDTAVSGKMYDTLDGLEYTNFRVRNAKGAFVHAVKTAYEDLLNDIDEKCFDGESHAKHWLIPANPNYYDIVNCFNDTNEIIWKQSNNIHVGDIVYQYAGSPVSAILYKCKVREVNIPYSYQGPELTIHKVMRIELMKRYDPKEFTFHKLNTYGVKAIRGPRGVPEALLNDLNA